jgi:phospholipase A1
MHARSWLGCALSVALFSARTRAEAQAPDVPDSAAVALKPAAQPNAAASPPPQLDLLTFYKDNYFLTGFTHETEVKFQFSAKFDVWPNRGPHAVYFAFSQRSLWNIYRVSQPFAENNYAPELFYSYFHAPNRYDPAPGCGFFLERVGLIHESTGEGGSRSRGWNRVYGESRFACYDAERNYGVLTLQLWAPPFGVTDNPDIVKYQGYGELSLGVGSDHGQAWLGDWELAVHTRKGTRGTRAGSVEADARWRPSYGSFWRFTPYLYGQFFTGYGETLLSYDRALSAIRVGIGFTDRSTRSQ